MRVGLRNARLSAAVVAVLYGSTALYADDLIWGVGGNDGDGNWNTTSVNWTNAETSASTTWSNANPDSAIIGEFVGDREAPLGEVTGIYISESITVKDIRFGASSNNSFFEIYDVGGSETLTITGNVIKSALIGTPQIALTNAIQLTAGEHVFALNDSPEDLAELTINSVLTGAGSLTLDNGFNDSGFAQWGTLVLNLNNSYSGGTHVKNGRIVINKAGALGTGAVLISDAGALAIGGAGVAAASDINLTSPITITRNTYSGEGFSNYTYALAAMNDGSFNTHTISGPLIIDSTDARIEAHTNRIIISSNIVDGPNVAGVGGGILTVGGDYAGFIRLTGNNTGLTGGIRLIGGVELEVDNHNSLGGPNSKLFFEGWATLRPIGGFMTNFGSHVINNTTFSGGINVDEGHEFTIDQPLGQAEAAVGSIGKRGLGTLNINETVNLRGGATWWDGGIVNVNSEVTLANLHLRSPVVNINDGGSITVVSGYNSLGQDSGGTNGGPDKAVVNIYGNGKFIQTSGDDFNISDNAGTEGTVNIYDDGEFTTGGRTWLGKNNDTIGRVNQYGGTININRTGDFGFVIGDGRGGENPTGYYTLVDGTFNSAGQVYVGEGGSSAVDGKRARGYWTQSGGTANIHNWFIIGREGAVGHFDMSGGVLNRDGGGNMALGDSNAGGEVNTIKVYGDAVINNDTGELWVGNNVGSIAVMDIYGNATLTTNNWFAIGRAGGTGTVNISENATVIKQGSNYLAVGSYGNAVGTLNQNGGMLISNATLVGEASNGTMNLNGGVATFTGEFNIGHNNNVHGTLNIGGTAVVTVPDVVFGASNDGGTGGGTLNLNGGTLTGSSFTAGPQTGSKIFKFNGGTLLPAADADNFISAGITGVVSTGGAKINTNGFSATINAPLTHDAELGGADGGLTKMGTGTLRLNGANTYTGATVVQAGTLELGLSAHAPVLSGPGGADIQGGRIVFDYTDGVSPAADVLAILDAGYDVNFATGQIRSSTANSEQGLGWMDDGTAVIVAYTYYGDVNLDGQVDGIDLTLLGLNWTSTGTTWAQGDLNYDGVTDGLDLTLLGLNWQAGVSSPSAMSFEAAVAAAGFTVVPEPAAVSVLAAAGLWMLGGRRRRQ